MNINKLGVANFDPSISADGKTIVFASDREEMWRH
ncbi:MAG: PD40 domain-containing protein [Saprospiraceae bacterium]|nr:PD40 domain-containing protein [Saprospiraceae bacterium]